MWQKDSEKYYDIQKKSTENYTKSFNPEIPVSNTLVGGEFFQSQPYSTSRGDWTSA